MLLSSFSHTFRRLTGIESEGEYGHKHTNHNREGYLMIAESAAYAVMLVLAFTEAKDKLVKYIDAPKQLAAWQADNDTFSLHEVMQIMDTVPQAKEIWHKILTDLIAQGFEIPMDISMAEVEKWIRVEISKENNAEKWRSFLQQTATFDNSADTETALNKIPASYDSVVAIWASQLGIKFDQLTDDKFAPISQFNKELPLETENQNRNWTLAETGKCLAEDERAFPCKTGELKPIINTFFPPKPGTITLDGRLLHQRLDQKGLLSDNPSRPFEVADTYGNRYSAVIIDNQAAINEVYSNVSLSPELLQKYFDKAMEKTMGAFNFHERASLDAFISEGADPSWWRQFLGQLKTNLARPGFPDIDIESHLNAESAERLTLLNDIQSRYVSQEVNPTLNKAKQKAFVAFYDMLGKTGSPNTVLRNHSRQDLVVTNNSDHYSGVAKAITGVDGYELIKDVPFGSFPKQTSDSALFTLEDEAELAQFQTHIHSLATNIDGTPYANTLAEAVEVLEAAQAELNRKIRLSLSAKEPIEPTYSYNRNEPFPTVTFLAIEKGGNIDFVPVNPWIDSFYETLTKAMTTEEIIQNPALTLHDLIEKLDDLNSEQWPEFIRAGLAEMDKVYNFSESDSEVFVREASKKKSIENKSAFLTQLIEFIAAEYQPTTKE